MFVTKWFDRWSRKESIPDKALCKAVDEMNRGLVDAEPGGQVVKKRVAAPGMGKSGSYRTLVAFKVNERAYFVYGFAKNIRANIKDNEERALKLLAKKMLGFDAVAIGNALTAGELREVRCNHA